MMGDLLVSVVIPTYKRMDRIYDTLDSVLNQSYERIELIVTDDGSPLFPEERIIDYIESNKKDNIELYTVIRNQENLGTVKNIHKAYMLAKGDILFPLAGDDVLYDPTVIKKVADHFMTTECNVLVTSRMLCEGNAEICILPKKKNLKKIIKLSTPEKQHKAIITERFYEFASGSVLYIRKKYYVKCGGFDIKYRLWEDGPFITRFTVENLIDTRFDICSIRYATGGVSNSGVNQLMRADRLLYNETDRNKEIKKYGWFTRRQVIYISKRYVAESNWQIFNLYLLYPDVMISKFIYKLNS